MSCFGQLMKRKDGSRRYEQQRERESERECVCEREKERERELIIFWLSSKFGHFFFHHFYLPSCPIAHKAIRKNRREQEISKTRLDETNLSFSFFFIIFLPFLALTLCLPIDVAASNIIICIIIDITWRHQITHLLPGSISFTYHLIPRGRKNISILHVVCFCRQRESNPGCLRSKECTIQNSISFII